MIVVLYLANKTMMMSGVFYSISLKITPWLIIPSRRHRGRWYFGCPTNKSEDSPVPARSRSSLCLIQLFHSHCQCAWSSCWCYCCCWMPAQVLEWLALDCHVGTRTTLDGQSVIKSRDNLFILQIYYSGEYVLTSVLLSFFLNFIRRLSLALCCWAWVVTWSSCSNDCRL